MLVAKWREDLDIARMRTADITSSPAEVDNLASAVGGLELGEHTLAEGDIMMVEQEVAEINNLANLVKPRTGTTCTGGQGH